MDTIQCPSIPIINFVKLNSYFNTFYILFYLGLATLSAWILDFMTSKYIMACHDNSPEKVNWFICILWKPTMNLQVLQLWISQQLNWNQCELFCYFLHWNILFWSWKGQVSSDTEENKFQKLSHPCKRIIFKHLWINKT